MKTQIENLHRNLNWATLQVIKHKSSGNSYTSEQWLALSDAERRKIVLVQNIGKEQYVRATQLIVTPEKVYGMKGKTRFYISNPEEITTKYNTNSGKLDITYQGEKLNEVSYQRIADVTYSIAYKIPNRDIEQVQFTKEGRPIQVALEDQMATRQLADGRYVTWREYYFADADARYTTTHPEYRADSSRFKE